ncbi:hypothetical protein [Actinokineospora xionganensis]|uniref:Uncharacterized protein n=1 Tax=Actinokineospora xionganensis TaxID=2684470 RepID=A0ABR7LAV0_9PSEU|nr:hypothetical protein [Actinokineospora xionganensis]MBC6449511.1 hypothetical protein [Actinokineospora xionganensis]
MRADDVDRARQLDDALAPVDSATLAREADFHSHAVWSETRLVRASADASRM